MKKIRGNLPESCTHRQIWNAKRKVCIDLDIYFGELSDLIKIGIKINEHKRETDPKSVTALNMNYTVVKLAPKEIQVQVTFADASHVDRSDEIEVKLAFNLFEKGVSTEKYHRSLVPQINSATKKKA